MITFVTKYFRTTSLVENRGNFNSAHYHGYGKPKIGIERDRGTVGDKNYPVFNAHTFSEIYFNQPAKNALTHIVYLRPEFCTAVTRAFVKGPIAYEFYVRDDLKVTTEKVTIFALLYVGIDRWNRGGS